MKLSDCISKKEFKQLSKDELESNFKFNLFEEDKVNITYTYYDRVILIGAVPKNKDLSISNFEFLHAKYFLENRELGIINIGNDGIIIVDGKEYNVKNKEALYIGKGSKEIVLKSNNKLTPVFYMMSANAHVAYPTKLIDQNIAKKVELGDKSSMNERTILQLIHPAVLDTCQLSMGITCLKDGSAWNTMPCHTHERRMEAYLYFDVNEEDAVFHFMGEPNDVRSVVLKNRDAIINPPWSVHFGVGTKNYNFIWGMAGENREFTDMDSIKTKDLK